MFSYSFGVILWYCLQAGLIGAGIALWAVFKK